MLYLKIICLDPTFTSFVINTFWKPKCFIGNKSNKRMLQLFICSVIQETNCKCVIFFFVCLCLCKCFKLLDIFLPTLLSVIYGYALKMCRMK